jgi:hypothetical protein
MRNPGAASVRRQIVSPDRAAPMVPAASIGRIVLGG